MCIKVRNLLVTYLVFMSSNLERIWLERDRFEAVKSDAWSLMSSTMRCRGCKLALWIWKNQKQFNSDLPKNHSKKIMFPPSTSVTQKWLFYLHLCTLCHKFLTFFPHPVCMTSSMNDLLLKIIGAKIKVKLVLTYLILLQI